MADTRIASTLVGAVLESTGYHYQEAVLQAFQSPFENEIGGLLYLFAIVMAVLYSATRGGFQLSAWLLIGPPLFFATIQVTDDLPNARWEFGEQARSQSQKDSALSRITGGEAEDTAEVSYVFSKYVKMISAVSQSLVAEISKSRENSDKWFLIKAQLFANLHTAQIDDPVLLDLLHRSVVIECSDAMYWAEAVNDPLSRTADATSDVAEDAVKTYKDAAKTHFAPGKAEAQKLYDAAVKHMVDLDKDAIEYLRDRFGAANINKGFNLTENSEKMRISCGNLWRLVTSIILQESQEHADGLIRIAGQFDIPPQVIQNLFLQASGAPRDDQIVFSRFHTSGDPNNPTNNPDTTPDTTNPTLPRMTADDAELIKRIIALYYLRNEINNPDRGSWIRWMTGRHESRIVGTQMRSENSINERSRVSVLEWANKERLIHTAASLPYYQGLILYVLGATFPFFALLLLIPGKHSGFLIWFILWIWAKSWDFFFAIVMLLDDVLFSIFAVQKQEIGHFKLLPEGAEADVGLAFAALRELDPSFQLSTYYTLVSVAMIAVPVASAQLFLGAAAQGAGLVEKGGRAFADAFADSAHHASVRTANIAMRAEGSALLARRSQLVGRLNGLEANVAMQRGNALSQGAISPEKLRISQTSDQRFVRNQGGNPAMLADENTRNARLTSMGRGGFGTGIQRGNSVKPFGDMPISTDAVATIAGLASGMNTETARGQAIQSLMNSEYNYLAAKLEWNAVEEQIRMLHMRAAPLGILPLPPSGFYEEPSEKTLELAYQHFRNEFEMRNAYIRNVKQLTEAVLTQAQKLFPDDVKTKSDLLGLKPEQKEKLARSLQNMKWVMGVMQIAPVAAEGATSWEEYARMVQQEKLNAVPEHFRNSNFFSQPLEEAPSGGYQRSLAPPENVMVSRFQYSLHDHPIYQEQVDAESVRQQSLASGQPAIIGPTAGTE